MTTSITGPIRGPLAGSAEIAPSTLLARHVGIATVVAAMLAVVGGRPGAALFALVAFGGSVLLYRREPIAYLSHAWWLWMVAPGLRRLVDYYHGFDVTSPVLLAPLLVSGVTLVDAVRHLPKMRHRALLPFALVGAGLFYGYLVGVVRIGVVPASYGFLTWVVPPAFGLHIALRWQAYPAYRRQLQRLVLYGTLVLSVYGLVQFFAPLAWDRQWVLDSGMLSIGRPAAYQIRVFSLLNSPGPFATVLAASLVALLAVAGPLRLVTVCCGAVALLLTLGRTQWLTCAVGMLVYLAYLRMGARVRAVTAMVLVTAAVIPVLVTTDVASVVGKRMHTLVAVEDDASYQARAGFTEQMVSAVASEPVGYGLGATGGANVLSQDSGVRSFDNGIVDVWYSLGWFGATLFFAGLVTVTIAGLQRVGADDHFASGARSAFLCLVLQMAGANVLTGVTGVVAWTFAGALIAARAWHRDQPAVERPTTHGGHVAWRESFAPAAAIAPHPTAP